MSDARLRNLERELTLDPARMDLLEEHARLLDRTGRADDALAALDLAWRLGRTDLEKELAALLASRRVTRGSLTYCYVPAGPFLMGCERGDSDEAPAHVVRLSAFFMAQRPLRWGDLEGWSGLVDQETRNMPYWRDQHATTLPFERARAALADLGGRVGLRMPTEAQWERARRASVLTPGRNIYGIDVGLGAEWTSDFYDSTYYDHSPRRDPTGPGQGEERVARGAFEGPDFVRRATYRESVDRDGNFEAVERVTKFFGLIERRGATRRLQQTTGLRLRACFPAGAP